MEEDRAVERLKRKYSSELKVCSINEIPIIDRLYLAAFLRSISGGISGGYIIINHGNTKLSPTSYFDREIIRHLLDNSYIRIASLRSEFIQLMKVQDSSQIDVLQASFELNVGQDGLEPEDVFDLLYYPDIIDPEEKELRELWMKIAKAECHEYVLNKIKEVGIPYKYTAMHEKHFEAILKNFSVSQFYCMYYSKLKTANYKQSSQRVSSVRTLHSSIYGALTYSEKGKANNWSINRYGREKWWEQSIISEVFFTKFLKIGKLGFSECPETFNLAMVKAKYGKDESDD